MIKQKFVFPLAAILLLPALFACNGGNSGPKTVNVDVKAEFGAGYLISDPFSVNKDDQVIITVDFSNFPANHNYYNFAFFEFAEVVGDDFNVIDYIYSEFTSFKYNEEDLTCVESLDQVVNNSYMIYDYPFSVDLSAKLIALRHDSPAATDKITITGKAKDKYDNICLDFNHKNFNPQI